MMRSVLLAVALVLLAPARQAATPPPASESLLGVNADLTALPEAELRAVVARLADADVRAVRLPVRWAEIEPAPGRYTWAALDRVIEALDTAGIRPLLTLHTSPGWSRHDPPPPRHWLLCADSTAVDPARAASAPPTDPADLADFATALVRRYRGGVWALEVWREPNLLPNWRRGGPDPEDYARLLATTAEAVHQAAPEVLIVSAGLAPTTDIGVCYMSDLAFLARLARTGALDQVDAVGIEPFGLRSGPGDRQINPDTLNFSRAELLHGVLRQAGVEAPLWALAWGWNARLGPWTERSSPWGSHPPERAARWLGEGWARARAEWPWLGPMFVWRLQADAPADDPAQGFALLDAGRPTVLWQAVADIAAGRIPPAPAVAPMSPWQRWGRWGVALLGLVAALAMGRVVRWAAEDPPALAGRRAWHPVKRGLGMVRSLDPWQAAGVYAALVALNIFAPWPIALAALGLAVPMAALHPAVAAAAVAAMLPFYHTVLMQLGPRLVSPVELLVWVGLGGWWLRWWAADRPGRLRRSMTARDGRIAARNRVVVALDLAAIALLAWSAASLLWSAYPAPAIYQLRTVILDGVLFYGLLRALPERREGMRRVCDGLVLGGVVAALWALFGIGLYAAGLRDLVWSAVAAEGVLRANGPFGSPNNLALFLGRLVPVLAAFALWGTPARRRGYGLAALPIGLALLATFSRAMVVVGLPVIALYLAWAAGIRPAGGRGLRASRRTLLVPAITALLLVLLLLPFAGTTRVRGTFSLAPGSTLYIRTRLWVSALEMARDHPWLGVGLDNFLYHYRERYVKRDVIQDGSLNHPHNWLLDWWTRLGLPGLAIFGVLMLGNLWLGAIAIGRGPPLPPGTPDPDRALAVAALGMQVYALAAGLVDNSFFLIDLAAVWWIGQAGLIAVASGSVSAPGQRVATDATAEALLSATPST